MVAVYVVLVVFAIGSMEKFEGEETLLMPIAMLMLFVLSAAIVGTTVLLRPIMLYMNGAKVEAVKLLMHTIIFLAAFTVIAFIVLLTF